MSHTGIKTMDREVQTAANWVRAYDELLGWNDPDKSFQALRSTLTTLRERLSPDEASDLAAQLPVVLRGVYYDGYRPSKQPSRERHVQDFLDKIRERFNRQPIVDAEWLARTTFLFLETHITKGELDDVKASLPNAFSSLYTAERGSQQGAPRRR